MASAVKPKSPWREEYMFLNDPRIEAGRMRPAEWYLDDIVLTCVMIAGGLQDLVMGVLFWVSPNWSLEHMYSHDSTAINALTVALFEERDVLNQPHSLVRHPDMPRCVFKLAWDQLQAGKEIFAYVKNMAKSGDFYWVFAHLTPTPRTARSIS